MVYISRTKSTKDDWLTPRYIINALGPFDLDPCAPAKRPWPTAKKHYTEKDNGLRQKWHGFVWLNPPYGRQVKIWVPLLAKHGNGITLLVPRPDTQLWHREIFPKALAVFFFEGRILFCWPNGEPSDGNTSPSCLVAYGQKAVSRIESSGLKGRLVRL